MSPWLAPLLAQVVSLSAGDRTEARSRVDQSVVRHDIESLGWASFEAKSKRTSFELGYALLLSGLALGRDDQEFFALHTELLGASFRTRRTIISVAQAATYGERNFRALSVTPRDALTTRSEALRGPDAEGSAGPTEPGPREGLGGTTPPPEALPILIDRAIRLVSLTGAVGATSLLSRRLSATGYAGYDYSGGLDEVDQLVYPVFHGPFASLGASYRLTPRSGLSTYLTGRRAVDEDGFFSTVLVLEERWSYRFSRTLETELGLGISAVDSDIEVQTDNLPPYLPVAFAALVYHSRLAFEISTTTATLIITPGLDRLTGIIDERAELRFEQRWSDGEFDLLGSVAGSQSLTSVGFGLTSLGADGIAVWHFEPPFAVDTGLRGFWQKYADVEPLYSYAIYAGLRVSVR